MICYILATDTAIYSLAEVEKLKNASRISGEILDICNLDADLRKENSVDKEFFSKILPNGKSFAVVSITAITGKLFLLEKLL